MKKAQAVSAPARSSATQRRVVIVEDQRLVAEFLTLHCATLDLRVVQHCVTCREGRAAIRAHQPDLVLLDISLPDGDGLTLAKAVLDELPRVRILAVSSHRDPWTMLQVQRIGLHGAPEFRPGLLFGQRLHLWGVLRFGSSILHHPRL